MSLLAGAWLAVSLSAAAQDGAPLPPGRAIIFSAPAGESTASNAPLLAPQQSKRPDFANELRSPSPVFDVQGPSLPLLVPPGPPALSRTEAQQRQKILDERENWALMTPEEILGVDASRNALQKPGTEAADKNSLTVVERFLERQWQSHAAATNGFHGDNTASDWNFSSRRPGGLTNGSPSSPARTGWPATPQVMDRLFSGLPAESTSAGQNENQGAGWIKSPGQPLQPPAPAPEQPADRGQLGPSLYPELFSDAQPKSSPGSGIPPSLRPLSDPTPNQAPAVNPAGSSFTPLSGGMGRPAGLSSLPGIGGPTNSPSSAPPSWAPQPPPWLLQTPQPFTVPQRKF